MSETLEFCFKCDEPTGCAGKADDSWYNEDNEGPFCWRCWCEDQFPKVAEEVDALQTQISTLQSNLKQVQATSVMLELERNELQEKLQNSEDNAGELQICYDEMFPICEKARWIPVSERPPAMGDLVEVWGLERNKGVPIALIWDTNSKNYYNTHWREIDLPTGEQESK